MKTKAFLFAAIATTLVACDNNNRPAEEPVAAVINAAITDEADTRVAGNVWLKGDCIGVTTTSRGLTQYTNIPYAYDGSKFQPVSTVIYFQSPDAVTFRAYYPHSGTAGTDPAVVAVTTGADNQTADRQPSIDCLFASGATADKYNPTVNFTGQYAFRHCMSQLTLTLAEGDDISFATLEGYTLDNLKLVGTFDTATGTAAPADDAEATPLAIDLSAAAVANGQCVSSLILLPQPAAAGLPITIGVDGQQYKATLRIDGDELLPGSNYTFTVKVKKNAIDVQQSDIRPWNEVPGSELDAEM